MGLRTGQWVRGSLLVYAASARIQEASCYSSSIIPWEVGEPSPRGLWSQPAWVQTAVTSPVGYQALIRFLNFSLFTCVLEALQLHTFLLPRHPHRQALSTLPGEQAHERDKADPSNRSPSCLPYCDPLCSDAHGFLLVYPALSPQRTRTWKNSCVEEDLIVHGFSRCVHMRRESSNQFYFKLTRVWGPQYSEDMYLVFCSK